MELQATLSLSVLLLAIGGMSASPVPNSLISRLRRSAGTGGGSPSSEPSTHYTVHIHYNRLLTKAASIVNSHSELYSLYKTQRYANDTDPFVHDMIISYLPTTHSLPMDRSDFSDWELIDIHYTNLIIFKNTLKRVRDTETEDIAGGVVRVINSLKNLINRLETVMMITGQEENIIRVENNHSSFYANVTADERNTRTLLVFQEFHAYMPHVKADYEILQIRHSGETSA